MLTKSVFRKYMLVLESIYSLELFSKKAESEEDLQTKDMMITIWYDVVKNYPDKVFVEAAKIVASTHVYDNLKPAHISSACKAVVVRNTITVDQAFKELNDSFRKFYHGSEEGCQMAMMSYSPIVKSIVKKHGGFYAVSMMEGMTFDIFKRDFEKEFNNKVDQEVVKFTLGQETMIDFESKLMIEG